MLIFTRADLYCILNMFKYNLEQMKYTTDKMSVHGFVLGFISMLLYLFFQKTLVYLYLLAIPMY